MIRKLIVLLSVVFACASFAEDGLRIAHVDSKIIFDGYKGTRKAQEEYDRQVAKWEQQANLLQKELAAIKERLDKQVNTLLGAPLYIDDTPGLSVFELRTKARRLVREHGVKIIMIDYLQLMNANGMRFSSRQEEVSTISRSLKGLAKELDIPILALSQLNRGVESREGLEGKRPQLSDLRESGAIEQDADMVLFVHRPEYYHIYQDDNGRDLHGMAQIIIAKHRKGATGDVLLTFRGEFTRFENPEDGRLSRRSSNSNPDGEILGSKVNGDQQPTGGESPFGYDSQDGEVPF